LGADEIHLSIIAHYNGIALITVAQDATFQGATVIGDERVVDHIARKTGVHGDAGVLQLI
jgi:hypothetical protein